MLNRNKKGQFIKSHKLGMTGKKHSLKTRKRMEEVENSGQFQKGQIGYWKDKQFSEKHIEHLSEVRKGQTPWNTGKHWSKKTRKQIGKTLKGRYIGSKSPSWKGGITPENVKIRTNIEMKLWRESVFARDNWTCQKCLERGIYLQAHHIRNFADFLELRTLIENGQTLCKECHNLFHKKYGRKNNTKEQLEEFLALL